MLAGQLTWIRLSQTGFAPGVPHFANLPFALRHFIGFAIAALVHFTNFPFKSLQGAAAMLGTEVATSPIADKARMKLRI